MRASDPETGDWYHKLTAQGYEIFLYEKTFERAGRRHYPTAPAPCLATDTYTASNRTWWTATERPKNDHVEGLETYHTCTDCEGVIDCEAPEEYPYTDDDWQPTPSGIGRMGEMSWHWDWSLPSPDIDIDIGQREDDTRFVFRKFVPGVDKQLILLHFHDMQYFALEAGNDPSQITFKGQPGFRYGTDSVGFLYEIKVGSTVEISKADFTWPSYHGLDEVDERDESGRELWFDGWGNNVIKVDIKRRRDHHRPYHNVIVGEKINLEASVQPSGFTIDSGTWVIDTQKVIENWDVSERPPPDAGWVAEITPLTELNGTNVSYYWVDGS